MSPAPRKNESGEGGSKRTRSRRSSGPQRSRRDSGDDSRGGSSRKDNRSSSRRGPNASRGEGGRGEGGDKEGGGEGRRGGRGGSRTRNSRGGGRKRSSQKSSQRGSQQQKGRSQQNRRGGNQNRNGSQQRRRGGGRKKVRRSPQDNLPLDLRDQPSEGLEPGTEVSGILEVGNQGFGYLRDTHKSFRITNDDVYVGRNMVTKLRLRTGDIVTGIVGRGQRGRGPALQEVTDIDGYKPEAMSRRPYYRDLTSIDPEARFHLGDAHGDISMRLVDLLTPIGRGQRALIVAPPRTGKTVLLQKMSQAITKQYDDAKVLVLLIDERPEEVTDWKRNTDGEVYSSSSDEDSATSVRVSEIVLQRCQRMLEAGKDVVLLLDSLTRLGRAYNLETEHSGRTLSGGVDARTLEKPKAIFGAARNVENGGSLTIIATALIETGSRMDEVIFEEFKGTGNMELVLSRKLADLRIYPAIDVGLSGTRKEEKLYDQTELEQIWKLRRVLNKVNPVEGMELLKERLAGFPDNRDFLFSFAEG